MSPFGRGLKPATPHKIAHRLGAHQHPKIAAALAAGPRGSAMIDAPEPFDQGASATCHAHSAAAAVWCAMNAAGKPLAFVPSPRQIASCTYSDVRAATLPAGIATLPPLTDDGAELQDDATAMKAWGICPIQAPTSDGRNSDVENDPANNVFPEPDTAQLQQAAKTLIDGEYQISVDANAPKLVAASLDAGIPVWVGFFVDSAFEALTPSSVAQPPNENDPTGGGHAVFLRGYRTNPAGKLEFRLRNSWGSWCDGGDCWVSEAWLMVAWNLWPMAVAS